MSESPQLQTPASDAIAEDERRTHQRVPASKLTGMKAQLTTGPAVVLKDVSRSGARFQSESRLIPGLTVALKMVTPDGVVAVRGRVVRSRLVRMDGGGMGYEAAVSFTDLLPGLSDETASSKRSAAPASAPSPVTAANGSTPASKTPSATSAQTHASALASAPSAAPTGSPFAAPVGSPFAGLADDAPAAARATAPATPATGNDAATDDDDDDDDLPMMMLVTASVSHTTAELHEMFNGNDW